jgi:hypothetical protein
MSAKRFLITFALAALLAATGCRTWCERHYPCPTPVAAAPCCVPCAPTSGYAPAAPVQTWSSPAPVAGRRLNCVCE